MVSIRRLVGGETPSAIHFGGQPGHATQFYLVGQLHRFGLRRDYSAFAPRERCLCLVDGRKDFRAPPLPVFP